MYGKRHCRAHNGLFLLASGSGVMSEEVEECRNVLFDQDYLSSFAPGHLANGIAFLV